VIVISNHPLIGKWRIVEAKLWDRNHLDLAEPANIAPSDRMHLHLRVGDVLKAQSLLQHPARPDVIAMFQAQPNTRAVPWSLCSVCNPLRIVGVGFEEYERRRRLSLSGVHSEVGVLEDFFPGSAMVGNQCDADRKADPRRVACDRNL
jgi:hypothetical protein